MRDTKLKRIFTTWKKIINNDIINHNIMNSNIVNYQTKSILVNSIVWTLREGTQKHRSCNKNKARGNPKNNGTFLNPIANPKSLLTGISLNIYSLFYTVLFGYWQFATQIYICFSSTSVLPILFLYLFIKGVQILTRICF